MFCSNIPVKPDQGLNINLSGHQGVSLSKDLGGIVIEIDYAKLCEDVLRKVKRTQEGLITSEALIDVFMEITRESEEKK